MNRFMTSRYLFQRCCKALVFSAVLSFPFAMHINADELASSAQFDIPAQPLNAALVAFSEQADIQLVVQTDNVNGLETRGVTGKHSAREALTLLLADSGLTYKLVGNDTVAVSRAGGDEALGKSRPASNKILVARAGTSAEGAGTAAESTKGEKNRGMIDEIIVTSQKREAKLMDVPISITAITGEIIERAGIQTIADLSYSVPNLSVSERGPGNQTITLRGAGNLTGSSALVGVYLDEIPVSAVVPNRQINLQTLDLERVEVLRGPQGTLYGQGSAGGTIRFITHDPHFDGIDGKLGVSAYDTKGVWSKEFTGILNLPVVDDILAFRLAATYKDKGGWINQPATGRRDVNDSELLHFRLKGLWQVSDGLRASVMMARHRNSAGHDNVINLMPVGDSNYQAAVDPTVVNDITDDYDTYNLTVSYDFGFATLTSASSYFEVTELRRELSAFSFLAGLPAPFEGVINDINAKTEVFTQEVRFSSNDNSDSPFDWMLGVFYNDREQVRARGSADAAFGGFPFPSLPPSTQESPAESIAYFGDVSFAITDRLTMGVGTRYFEDDRETRNLSIGTTLGATFDNLSSKVYLSFAPTDDVNLYLRVAEGFRSGGFNSVTAPVPSFDPESLLSYEAGLKATLPEYRLQAEFALFYTDYTDFQAQFVNPIGQGYTDNPGEAEIKGFEWHLQWAATEQLLLGFSGNITNAEFTKTDPSVPTRIAGDPLDLVPDYSYSANADYQFVWAKGIDGFVRFAYHQQGPNTYVDRASGLAEEVVESEPLSLLNAQIGAEWGAVKLEVFARNLLDEDDLTTALIAGSSPQERPRTVGINIEYDF